MIEIVPMQSCHIEEILQLETVCFSDPWSEDAFRYQLTSDISHFLVACEDEKVLGYIGVTEMFEACEIANIAVCPETRRRGIATALLCEALNGAKSRECEFAMLEVRPSNEGAIALYEKHGFSEITRRAKYYSSPTEDAIVMRKYL